jgi:N-acetylmuramoyl-L-alanine amidase
MGAEVELGVGSDTVTLQIRRASVHGIARRRPWGVLFALALLTLSPGCGQDGPSSSAGEASSRAGGAGVAERGRARELLEPSIPLPSRAETVALADAVAIAAHPSTVAPTLAAAPSAEGASLGRLAADLRARLWRLDQAPGDAREAVELYAAAAVAAPAAEEGCEAERRRALLTGELARDAAVAYRELYVASRRQEGRAAARLGDGGAGSARCLASIAMALAAAVAYRPAGEGMRTLEHDGDLAADAARRGAPPMGPAPAPVEPGVGPASVSTATFALDGGAQVAGGDVVVSPKEEAVGKGPVKIVAVEPLSGEDAARVVVRLSGPATFAVGVLGEGVGDGSPRENPRVFVDVARATSRGIARETASTGLVRRVRLGAHAGGTRVVLDLAAVASRRVFFLPDPFRIVIDVGTRVRAPEPSAAPGAPRQVRRIAVDPGHGGNDAGAVGPTGLKEKEVTLDIAHRVAPLLAHEVGAETLLTRDTDAYVPLDLRAARANTFHADLFISIHCNASENGAARGVQTFILDEARDPDGVAAKVAARENAQRGREDAAGIAAVLTTLNPAEMAARSHHVAELLQRAALGSLQPRYPDTRDQGVKTAGFFVLVGADMPAVLFETAFISNAEEEGRLATADYRQKLADAILNAVRAYQAGK